MNTNILQKCLDELNKENPRIEYVKGMLETLIEMQPVTIPTIPGALTTVPYVNRTTPSVIEPIDEATLIANEANARMKNIVAVAV